MSGDAPHPADRLIHDLIAHPRAATEEEIRLITERIASAPFDTSIQKVPVPERGFTYQGHTLSTRADSLTLHLVRRVVGEQQWAADTTAEHYVADLHRASRDAHAHIALYRQWGTRDVASVIVPTDRVVEVQRLGTKSERNLIVVYNATRGILTSGYQFSTMDKITIPDDALWLK